MITRWTSSALTILGLSGGALASALVAGVSGVASPHEVVAATAADEPFIEATHVPVSLTVSGDPVDLRYDVYCGGPDEEAETGACDATGSVFVRKGDVGDFAEIPLVVDPSASDGRFVARVPDDIATSPDGFSYYATFRSLDTGASATEPAGGSSAPQRSLPLGDSVDVHLGTHVFGATTAADDRVADAAWGEDPGDAGLERGQSLTPLGGSSFDVARDGTVDVLDEAHRRVLRWRQGANDPEAVPVAVNGTLADLAVSPDGDSMYVLESTAEPGRSPLLRRFSEDGKTKTTARIGERMASQIRMGPAGPVALEQPSGAWMPVMDGDTAVTPESQRRRGRSGRPVVGGDDVVVLRTGDEIRAAIVGPGGVRRSWRITSDTPLGEVQLGEPSGNRLVLVFRVYTATKSEFVALVLDRRGVARKLSLDSADWAETAPLSKFRMAGGWLYRLGSSSRGLFVDRYSLGVS
jgi:hypothetical protein